MVSSFEPQRILQRDTLDAALLEISLSALHEGSGRCRLWRDIKREIDLPLLPSSFFPITLHCSTVSPNQHPQQ
jgi:hypothetical protein